MDHARERFHIDRLSDLGPLLDGGSTAKVRRATEAMKRCVAEGHLAEDEEE
jgi:hypothetical protein